MKANLKTILDEDIKLSKDKWLTPLCEAISNSFDSIEKNPDLKNGFINIEVQRDENPLLTDSAIPNIVGFQITDNGVGFTNTNYNSFDEYRSDHKKSRGGKGVGRITWLKVFDLVRIKSVFEDLDSQLKERTFTFAVKFNGIDEKNATLKVLNNGSTKEIRTSIILEGFKHKQYGERNTTLEELNKEIAKHFFAYFADLSSERKIELIFNDSISPKQLAKSIVQSSISSELGKKTFSLKSYDFTVRIFECNKSLFDEHTIIFLANKREVKCFKFRDKLHNFLFAPKNSDGKIFVALLESNFLDTYVNKERTGFEFPSGELSPQEEDIDDELNSILSGIAQSISEQSKAVENKLLSNFTQSHPEHRLSLNNPEIKNQIDFREFHDQRSNSINETKLDNHLLLLNKKVTDKAVDELTQQLNKMTDISKFAEYKESLIKKAHLISDSAKSSLATYVAHRKTILELLEKGYELVQNDSRKELEKVFHEIVFPMNKTSNEVEFDRQNLWVLDEKLVFHSYLGSDIKLSSIEKLDNSSPKEVDLIVFNKPEADPFNKPHSFVESSLGYDSISIFEFKSIDKTNHTLEDNPIKQVIQYIDKIKKGNARDKNNNPVEVPNNLPFYAYIVCNGLRSLEENVINLSFQNLVSKPSGKGFYGYLPRSNAYVDITDYQDLIKSASQRNRAFFKKLGL